jgi:hypothetical protein
VRYTILILCLVIGCSGKNQSASSSVLDEKAEPVIPAKLPNFNPDDLTETMKWAEKEMAKIRAIREARLASEAQQKVVNTLTDEWKGKEVHWVATVGIPKEKKGIRVGFSTTTSTPSLGEKCYILVYTRDNPSSRFHSYKWFEYDTEISRKYCQNLRINDPLPIKGKINNITIDEEEDRLKIYLEDVVVDLPPE